MIYTVWAQGRNGQKTVTGFYFTVFFVLCNMYNYIAQYLVILPVDYIA